MSSDKLGCTHRIWRCTFAINLVNNKMTNESTAHQTITQNTRNDFLDSLKGLAIILVVWGHSIQYVKKDGVSFFDNPLFIIIYSFHMPFFMIISGYLFNHSLHRYSGWLLSLKKTKQLLIPAVSWFLIESFLVGINSQFSNLLYGSVFLNIKNILYGSTYFLWFLSSLFALSIAYIICYSINKKMGMFISVLAFMLLLFCGDEWSSDKIKFMAPYFMAGILIHKNLYFIKRNKNVVGLFSIVTWILMLLSWDKQYYIYITPMSYLNVDFWQHTKIIIFRYLIGFAGSFSIFYFCYFAFTKNISFSKLTSFCGRYTLPIYAISTIIIYRIADVVNLNIFSENVYIYNIIVTPLFSAFILSVCILIAKIIKKNSLTSLILFGGR